MRNSACWILWIWLGLASCAEPSQAAAPTEYQVKAAFLVNFARFVEWPSEKLPQPDSPIIIGVLGADPFGGDLEKIASNATAGPRPLRVRHVENIHEGRGCHILYIAESERLRLPQIFAALRESNVLTVGETDEFAMRGGVIGFRIEDKKVRLDVNLKAAEAARLKLSSKLLSVSRIVAAEDN